MIYRESCETQSTRFLKTQIDKVHTTGVHNSIKIIAPVCLSCFYSCLSKHRIWTHFSFQRREKMTIPPESLYLRHKLHWQPREHFIVFPTIGGRASNLNTYVTKSWFTSRCIYLFKFLFSTLRRRILQLPHCDFLLLYQLVYLTVNCLRKKTRQVLFICP